MDTAYTEEGHETLQVRWYYNEYSSSGGGGEERRPFVASTTTSRGRATEISSSAFKMPEGGISLALPLLIAALVRRAMLADF